jgi:hypothetical protein
MAYLSPEFQHDVFISYAHGDFDRAGTSDLKEWSLAFAGKFEAELRESLSSGSPRIFIDEGKKHDQRLDRSDPLVEQLRGKASGAAFLLILMSPLYLRSDWCLDELTWWFDATKAQAFPEIRSRHFVARIRPVKDDSWPAQLRDEGHPPLGYWFHERPGDEFYTRPFGWSSRTDGELKCYRRTSGRYCTPHDRAQPGSAAQTPSRSKHCQAAR